MECALASPRIRQQNGSQIKSRRQAAGKGTRHLIRKRGGAFGELLLRRLRSIPRRAVRKAWNFNGSSKLQRVAEQRCVGAGPAAKH